MSYLRTAIITDPTSSTSQAAVVNSAVTASTYGVAVHVASPIGLKTGALVTVTHEGHEIHEGNSFCFQEVLSLGNAGSQQYLITVPDTTKWPHFLYFVEGLDAGVLVTMSEGADRSGTTAQTLLNRNRNSATTATTLLHKGVSSGSTDGSPLIINRKFGQNRTGGSGLDRNERVLKRNTKYVFTVTNASASNNSVQVILDWDEQVDFTQ